MSLKKKIFPKIKKSLTWFLTDESWKVTKKDILGISAWTLLVSWLWIEKTLAAPPPCSHVSNSPHSSSCWAWPSQSAVSGYSGWGHISTTLRWSSFSYNPWLAWSPDHGSAMWWASWHGSSTATSAPSVTAYNSGWHLSYTSRWSSTSQWAVSWYTHSSSSSHNSYMTPGTCP
jgi:hypothetical protein